MIVQGIGNVGYWAARFCEASGAKVIGLVEYNSSMYNPDGFHIDDAFQNFRTNKSFKDYPKATVIKLDDDRKETMYK